MNAIVFQLKRAHRASVRVCRWLIAVVPDMTPARFDIMLLLRHAGWSRGFKGAGACLMGQSSIVRELGLHKSTVSEALAKLVELGWIEKCRDFDDRREMLVQMTDLGLARTWAACKLLFRQKVLKGAVDAIVRQLEPLRPFNEAFDRVWENINALARFFGDTSTYCFYDRQSSYSFDERPTWMHMQLGADGARRLKKKMLGGASLAFAIEGSEIVYDLMHPYRH